jgi:malonyl-CoA O-methyltransferase
MVFAPLEYKEAAFMAKKAGHEMLSRLEWMTLAPQVILDLGAGLGEMSALLLERYPHAKVIALDNNMEMTEAAKEKHAAIDVICADGNNLPLKAQSVDLIFANFFLPWQLDVKAILSECVRLLRPDGVLMLSALGIDTLHEWRSIINVEESARCVDMHDIGDALVQAGFSDPVLDVDHYHVKYQDNTRLMNDLFASMMWFPKEKEIILDAALQLPLMLTYEVIYAHAFAKEKSNEFAQDGEGIVRIPLAHLRRR